MLKLSKSRKSSQKKTALRKNNRRQKSKKNLKKKSKKKMVGGAPEEEVKKRLEVTGARENIKKINGEYKLLAGNSYYQKDGENPDMFIMPYANDQHWLFTPEYGHQNVYCKSSMNDTNKKSPDQVKTWFGKSENEGNTYNMEEEDLHRQENISITILLKEGIVGRKTQLDENYDKKNFKLKMKNSDLFIEYDNESDSVGEIPNIQFAEQGKESKNWLIISLGMITYCQSETQAEAEDWINIINTAKKEGDTIDNTVEPSEELRPEDDATDRDDLRKTIYH